MAEIYQIANAAYSERARLFRQMRSLEVPVGQVLRKPPPCVASVPMLRLLELAYFREPAPKCLVLLNEEAARVGLNAYLPVAALPLRGREFFEEWTCANIIPMLQSRLRHQKPTQEDEMAQVLEQLPTRTRAGRTAKYPYDEWLDGQIWQLTQGEDFEGEIPNFTQALRQAADSRGKFVTAVKASDTAVAVQARPLTDEDRERREAISAKRAATRAASEKEQAKAAKSGKTPDVKAA